MAKRMFWDDKMESQVQAVQKARKAGKLPLGGKCHFVKFKDNGTRGLICGWEADGRVQVMQKGVVRVAALNEFDVITDQENALANEAERTV